MELAGWLDTANESFHADCILPEADPPYQSSLVSAIMLATNLSEKERTFYVRER